MMSLGPAGMFHMHPSNPDQTTSCMKYSDLPNITRVPYIQVNGCEDEDDEWPVIDDGYIPPGLTRQGSVSCEVLTFLDEAQRAMPSNEASPYVQVGTNGTCTSGAKSRSRGISRDGEYVREPTLRPATRKNKATSLDKDPEEDEDYEEEEPRQGITDVALRDYASKRRSGVPSTVYQVLYDFANNGIDELKLNAGDTVTCIMDNTGEPGWYYGESQDGKMGFFPASFVKYLGHGPRQIRMSQVSFEYPNRDTCLLGSGGCADVYKVRYGGGMAALKVFRQTSRPNAEGKMEGKTMEAVRQEALLINRLAHPNIIKLYGVCLDSPNVGLLLELCEGRALKNMLMHVETTNTFVSVRVMVDWAIQVATAMEYLINQDILHRDLKAENVLVKERFCYCDRSYESEICPACNGHTVRAKLTLKITDFGTTKEKMQQDDKRNSTHIVGTYSWMAPEAFRHHKYTEASDVWSFGVVLWEILTRKEPYEGIRPCIAAFHVANKGSTLEVDNRCPDRWGVVMKSCWEVDPKLRPTFSVLNSELLKYQKDLEADQVSFEEEERVENAQKEIMDIITKFTNNPHETIQYTACYEKLYKKIDEFMIGSKKEQTEEPKKKEAPEKPRRKNYRNIKKADIGAPMDTRHMASIRPARTTSTSPHGSGHLQVILSDKLSPSSSAPGQVQDYAGTLPRIPRKPLEKEAHPSLINALSISSPNLNNITDGNSTLRRKDAIKRKNKNLATSPNHGGTETPPKDFASISVANSSAQFVDILTTPVRIPSKEHSKSAESKKSEDETHKDHKRFGKMDFLAKLFKRSSKSIEDSGEEHSGATTPTYSARSSTSSSSRMAQFAHMTRSPAPLDVYQRQNSRPRVTSNTFASDEENFASPARRNKISPSENSRTSSMSSSFAPPKSTTFTQLENLNPRPRTMGIDDTLPSPSEIHGAMEYQQHNAQHRGMSHYRTPSDEVHFTPLPEFPRNTPTMSPPAHSAPKLLDLELSTVIPAADADYPEDNPYIQCPPIPAGHNAVNNSPYIQMPAKTVFHGVTNDQYFNCAQRPMERPDTLPLKGAATPESSGISTGGSSAFSGLSVFNESVPTIQAPPPPMLPRAPPAIPPREGSVGLPQFAS